MAMARLFGRMGLRPVPRWMAPASRRLRPRGTVLHRSYPETCGSFWIVLLKETRNQNSSHITLYKPKGQETLCPFSAIDKKQSPQRILTFLGANRLPAAGTTHPGAGCSACSRRGNASLGSGTSARSSSCLGSCHIHYADPDDYKEQQP